MKRLIYFIIIFVLLFNYTFVAGQVVEEVSSIKDILFNGDYYIAVGEKGFIIKSFDGIDWSVSEVDVSKNLYSITWGMNKFVAVGEGGTIITSTDGVTWLERNSGIKTDLYGVEGDGDKFIAVGEGGIIPCITRWIKMV